MATGYAAIEIEKDSAGVNIHDETVVREASAGARTGDLHEQHDAGADLRLAGVAVAAAPGHGLRYLNAWTQSLCKNPGEHHRMHSASIA